MLATFYTWSEAILLALIGRQIILILIAMLQAFEIAGIGQGIRELLCALHTRLYRQQDTPETFLRSHTGMAGTQVPVN